MIKKIIKTIWVISTLIVLAISLYVSGGDANSDIGMLFLVYMNILSFPAGILVQFFQIILYLIGLGEGRNAYVVFTFEWCLFFTFGYLQWFVIIPHIYGHIKNKLKEKT
jgi:hypothetical protein